MSLPSIYSYMRSVHDPGPPDAGLVSARFFSWSGTPIGVTAVTNPAGLVLYALLFGDGLTAVTPTTPSTGWTTVSTGAVGDSTFILFRRVTAASEPEIFQFTYTPTDSGLVMLAVAISGAAGEIAGTPLFDIGNTASSDALTVPTGNVLSVHMWGGAQTAAGGSTWEPNGTEFPSGRRMTYKNYPNDYAGSIGELRSVTTAPGKPASVTSSGHDNFGIQYLFSDIPIAVGGWGVGQVRMGAN